MADFPSRLDLYAVGRDYLLQRARKIDPRQVDISGSDANVFVGSTSVMAFEVLKQLMYSVNRLLLDGADGEDLDRYAWDRYQLPRKGASPALGEVVITRPTSAAGLGTVPRGALLATTTNFQYVTTSPASFGPTDLVSRCNVRAVIAGKAAQAGDHQIRKNTQPQLLWDQTLEYDNPLPTAGGEDREDDDTFRSRVRDFWNTARRGILAAIEFGAKKVPGVVSAQAIEVVTQGSMPARVVLLYVADSSGVSSRALGQLVDQQLLEYRAGGIAVITGTSVPEIVDVLLHLTFRSNVDTVSLAANVRGAIVGFVNSLPVNAPLTRSQLQSVLQRYVDSGLVVDEGTLVAPAGDVVPSAGKTIRTTLANVAA